MKLNRTLVMCLTIALAAALAIGSTTAYLTSMSGDRNTMTVGNVSIIQHEKQRDGNGSLEDFQDGQKLIPAYYENLSDDATLNINGTEHKIWDKSIDGELDKIVTVENNGSEPAYIRTIFAFEDTNDMSGKLHVRWAARNLVYPKKVLDDGTTDWTQFTHEGATYTVCVFTYEDPLAVGAISEPSMMQMFWDKTVDGDWLAQAGEEYEILVLSQAVQTQMGDLTAAEALDEAFGKVDPDNEAQIKQWFADAGLLPVTTTPDAGEDTPADGE